MRRLSIEISVEQHQRIKAMAVLQGKSIKDLVLDKIFGGKPNETDALEQLMLLLDKRIEEAENEGISSKTIDDIAQNVLNRNNPT